MYAGGESTDLSADLVFFSPYSGFKLFKICLRYGVQYDIEFLLSHS